MKYKNDLKTVRSECFLIDLIVIPREHSGRGNELTIDN